MEDSVAALPSLGPAAVRTVATEQSLASGRLNADADGEAANRRSDAPASPEFGPRLVYLLVPRAPKQWSPR